MSQAQSLLRLFTLAYHDVITHNRADRSGFKGLLANHYKLTPKQFEHHLDCIAQTTLEPSCIHHLVSTHQTRSALLLTFDDGGVSAIQNTAEALERRGARWRGHFFIVTDRIGQAGFLTGSQLRELSARGHVIGSHSASHPYPLAQYPPAEQQRQWQHSFAVLADILGQPVNAAAMPGGSYSRHAACLAAAAGARFLFTLEPVHKPQTIDGCLIIGRHLIRRSTRAEHAAAYARGAPLRCAIQWLAWNSRKLPKALGGRYYDQLKSSLAEHHWAVFRK